MMRKHCWQNALSLIFVIGVTAFSGCSRQELSSSGKYSEVRSLMGTTVQLDVCRDQLSVKKIDSAYQDAWGRLETIAWKMNALDDRSDVAKVNHSNLKPVVIGADTYRVIREAIRYSKETKGAFDITVWPLIDFWKKSAQKNIFPAPEEIKKAQSAVGLQNIQLISKSGIRLLNADTKIDLGGIAKGYAVDEAARIFREHGIENFFIDAGGDIYVGGVNCLGESWRIGIRDPQNTSKIIDVVILRDKAVVTSGDYERYYEIQGERWSHIIDPISGYPQKGVMSASVIAPSAMEADALATALCVLGGEAGTDYMNTLAGARASLIMSTTKPEMVEKFESQEYKNFKYKK